MNKFYMVWIFANKKKCPKLYSIEHSKKEAKQVKKNCVKSGYYVEIEKIKFN